MLFQNKKMVQLKADNNCFLLYAKINCILLYITIAFLLNLQNTPLSHINYSSMVMLPGFPFLPSWGKEDLPAIKIDIIRSILYQKIKIDLVLNFNSNNVKNK